MARARLLISTISQVDLSTPVANTNVVAGQKFQIYEIDGTTNIGQSMYAAVSGGSPISNPVTADGSGNVEVYATYAQRIKYKFVIGGVPTGTALSGSFDPPPDTIEATDGSGWHVTSGAGSTHTGNVAISGPRPWIDCFVSGARPTATASVNTAAIQAAIDFAIASGGGRVYLRSGTYHINSDLNIYPALNRVSVEFMGDGMDSTWIVQDTGGANVFTVGHDNGSSLCNYTYIHDLTTQSGNRGISLNNTTFATIERWRGDGHVLAVIGLGQNERLLIHNINIEDGNGGGMYFGAHNGSSGGTEDYSLLTKSVISKVNMSGCSGGPGLTITTGLFRGAHQIFSIQNRLADLQFENVANHNIDLSYCSGTIIDGFSNEIDVPSPMTTNTYSLIRQGTSADFTHVSNMYAAPSTGGVSFKYCIESLGGDISIDNSNLCVSGSAGTQDVWIGGKGHLEEVVVTAAANVHVANVGDVKMDNVRDISRAPITDWPAGTPWIVRSTSGTQTGKLGVGVDPSLAPLQVLGNGLFKTASGDLSLTMDPFASNGQGLHVWSRNGAVKWQHGMSADATPNFDVTGPSAVKSMSLSGSNGVPTFGAGAIIGTNGNKIAQYLTTTTTWAITTIANGANQEKSVTLTGASLSNMDLALAQVDHNVPSGCVIDCVVSGTDSVRASITNNSGGLVTINATWNLRVSVIQH